METNIKQGNALSIQSHPDSDMERFHLIILSAAEEMYDLWLPAIPEGFFRFSDNPEHRFFSVSSKNGYWVANCHEPAYFQNVPMEQCYEVPLVHGQLLNVEIDDRAYAIYVEKVTREQMVYHNYPISPEAEISIGRQASNDINYDNPYVSRKHAVIIRSAGQWTIQDCGSRYGVYINGIQKTQAMLEMGDIICIMGLRIIVGPNLLSINDNADNVIISQRISWDHTSSRAGHSYHYDHDADSTGDSFYNRLPRKRLEMPQQPIVVEGPPMSMDQKRMPLILRMGSSMVMGGMAALAGNFTTLISSVMFPFISSKYTEKQRAEYEQLRLSKYTEYLVAKREEILSACRNERFFLNQKYPAFPNVVNIVGQRRHLWERRPADSDFLHLRLGTGTQRLTTPIEYPPRRFELETDKLEEEMYKLVETPYYVDNVPITLSLTDTHVCGLLGSRERVIEYIRQLVLQLASFHSYDEVKLLFLLNSEELEQLDDIRYLPHAWDDQCTKRFIATSEADAYKLGEYIQEQLPDIDQENKDWQRNIKNRPFYVVFALDKKLFECHEFLKHILQSDEAHGVSVICAYNDLPKETQKIISLNPDDRNICTTMIADGSDDVVFGEESCEKSKVSQAMRILANTRLKTVGQSMEMPKMVTFLEMFQVGRIEQLTPLKRWQENNPVKSLATPVGIGTDGSAFMLDLHEKRQGPHGLIAGTTGSGKSEFIITYILSMAINYHPDEVTFLLIDYKGGGLAGAFDNPQTGVHLPHLVGTITNLDGASIQRSLVSIESELVRRQKIFNEVKSAVNEGTMDIYDYQKLYREGKVSKPMPHLFIISDEFAELKQQCPDFMDSLISAARIGRSLGVHLILATQKPSGVVNDQIRSNTKFRVCLRVQDRGDSMDMLKRPEAAELTDTGRFYLQVGYNEYFAMGQSAWCGAPYEPKNTAQVQRDDTIVFLDTIGQVIATAKPKTRSMASGKKQVVAIVEYLSALAKKEMIQVRQLWMEELPSLLDMEAEKEKYPEKEEYTLTIGSLDDPTEQMQYPMQIDFLRSRNMLLVGDSGCGKTMLIHNILYSLSNKTDPRDFNFYVLDYSGRRTKMFSALPHCGVVLYEEDDISLDAFFATIREILRERKRLFSELEVDNFEATRMRKRIPLVLVAIDGYGNFAGTKKGDSMGNVLLGMLKESPRYGVKFIITCKRPNEASPRIKQALEDRICMHLLDKYDYLELLGSRVKYVPPEIPGRGLVVYNEKILEFQCAIYWATLDNQDWIARMKSEIEAISKNCASGFTARRLPVVSDNAEYKDFASQYSTGRIPLGYSRATGKPVVFPLKQYKTLCVYFGNPKGRIPITENILFSAKLNSMEVWVIRRNEGSIFAQNDCKVNSALLAEADYLSCSNSDEILLQKALIQTMKERKKIVDDFCERNGIDATQEDAYIKAFPALFEKTKPILLLIESLEDFLKQMSPLLASSYESLLKKTWQRNIYVMACVDPDMPKASTENELFNYLQKNEVLLFGGQINRQKLCDAVSSEEAGKTSPYNLAIMKYRKQYHPLSMPCGIITEEPGNDEDLLSII